MLVESANDPVAMWARFAGWWILISVTLAWLLAWLAASLEKAAGGGSEAMTKHFDRFIENTFLALAVLGIFFFLNLAFSVWETRVPEGTYSQMWRVVTIALVIVLVLGLRALMVSFARYIRLRRLERGAEAQETSLGEGRGDLFEAEPPAQ